MDEQAAVSAIKKIVSDNAPTLVQGLFAQGAPILVTAVSGSILTPPIGSYHVAINILDVTSQSRPDGNASQVAKPIRQAIYQTQIWLAGSGTIEPKYEDHPYELAHRNFRLFGDRIVNLLENQGWMPDPVTSQRFEIQRQIGQDRAINKRNEIDPPSSTASVIAGLLSVIDFRLAQNCGSESSLYRSS